MRKLLLFVLLALPLAAQNPLLQVTLLNGVTTTGASSGADLGGRGVVFHILSVYISGTVSTCTIALQSSTDDTTYGNITAGGGTSNPFTCTSEGQIVFLGYKRFLRANLTVLTGGGSVTAVLQSYAWTPSLNPYTSTSGTGTGSARVQGAGAADAALVGDPIILGAKDIGGGGQARLLFAGALRGNTVTNSAYYLGIQNFPMLFTGAASDETQRWTTVAGTNNTTGTGVAAVGSSGQYNAALPTITDGRYNAIQIDANGRVITANAITDPCQSSAVAKSSKVVAVTADAELVAISGSTVIYVCGWAVTVAGTAPTYRLIYGTGSVCATGLTALTGTYAPTAGSYNAYGGAATLTKTPAGNALCLDVGGTTPDVEGILTYVQQ